MSDADTQPIANVIGDVRHIAQDHATVSIRAVVEALGPVSHSGLILVPALIAATPLSGIPGLTSVCGVTIAVLAAQMVFSKEHLWLPDWLLRRKVGSGRLRESLDKAKPVIQFLDRHTQRRLRVFVSAPGRFVLKLMIVACGLTMPFLEIIPFSGSLMAAVVVLLCIALLTRDGLFAVFGIGFLTIVLGVVLYFI